MCNIKTGSQKGYIRELNSSEIVTVLHNKILCHIGVVSMCFPLLLMCCSLLAGAENQSADVKEQESLEGTWSFVSPMAASKANEKRAAVQVVFKGNTVAFGGPGNKRTTQGTYTVDLSQTPKTMDIILDNKGTKITTKAIYELDGETLKLCHYLGAMASKERPKEFVTDKQTVLGILKREKM
jgi:uncharacterized protein (TIGR03067 family)